MSLFYQLEFVFVDLRDFLVVGFRIFRHGRSEWQDVEITKNFSTHINNHLFRGNTPDRAFHRYAFWGFTICVLPARTQCLQAAIQGRTTDLGHMNRFDQEKPWENWELEVDIPSVESLEKELANVPKWRKVLVKIMDAIEGSKDYADLIPNAGPVPVASVVKALIQLMSLAKLSLVAGDIVREFIKDLAIWVRGMLCAFRGGESGPSMTDTWNDFKLVADILEEIFEWAKSRLDDRSLQRAIQRLKVPGKLNEFRDRLAKARDTFKEVSIVRASKEQDRQTQLLNTIRRSQEDEARKTFLFEQLKPRFELPLVKEPCHPGTREKIFVDIGNWVFDASTASPRLFYVTGMPGSGKSAIASSIAKEFGIEGLLWAQHFFDRHDPKTTDATEVFRSVALQLVEDRTRPAEVLVSIFDSLVRDKSIAKIFDHNQVQHLFIDPLNVAANCDLTRPVVIVFDALDEGERDIKSFSRLLANSIQSLPPNVKIFITFRPDTEVANIFTPLQGKGVRSLFLDTDDLSSQTDVDLFIRDRLCEITRDFNSNRDDGYLKDNWIGEQDIDDICTQASGLFLWAKTTIIFIEDRLKTYGNRPTKIKETLIILKIKPFAAAEIAEAKKKIEPIGKLFMAILQSAYPTKDSEGIDEFRRIVGAVVLLAKPLSLRNLRDLLYPLCPGDIEIEVDNRASEMREDESGCGTEDVPDFQTLFLPLRSIFKPDAATIGRETIPHSHKSFVDFIKAPNHSLYFCINPTAVHEDLALQCLERLRTLPQDIGTICNNGAEQLDSNLSPLCYACHYWEHHLLGASLGECNTKAFDTFARTTLLGWIGVFSVLKGPQDTLRILESSRIWRSRSRQMNAEIMEVVSRFCLILHTLVQWDLKHSHWDEEHFRLGSENLRIHYLPDVSNWLHDQTAPRLLWVTGQPGIGKTILARAIAGLAARDSLLGASFFFQWRQQYTMDLISRDIAFQLCGTLPYFILELFKTIEEMNIPLPSLSNLQELMIKSMQQVDPLPMPLLIVIDALDECHNDYALSLLHMFARCFDSVPSLKLLVTSRSMPVECHAFSRDEFKVFGRILALDAVLNDDIRTFLQQQLKYVAMESGWHNWPSEELVNDLVVRASGRFIWAANFVRHLRHHRFRHFSHRSFEDIVQAIEDDIEKL